MTTAWRDLQHEPISWEMFLDIDEEIRRDLEIVDGYVVPREQRSREHQKVATRLSLALETAAVEQMRKTGGGECYETNTEVDVLLWEVPPTAREPDAVLHRCIPDTEQLSAGHVLIAAEVLSTWSARRDRVHKMSDCADAGIPHYWLVSFDKVGAVTIERHALAGGAGRYVHVGTYHRDMGPTAIKVSDPFPVEILWSDLEVAPRLLVSTARGLRASPAVLNRLTGSGEALHRYLVTETAERADASVREVGAAGLEALMLATELLQRARRADPKAGLWEAADVQWWWRKPRRSDEVEKLFWIDDEGPVAGVLLTSWTDAWQCDPVIVPRASGLEPGVVWRRAIEHAEKHSAKRIEVPVSDDDRTFQELARRTGFTVSHRDSTAWMDAADRPSVPAPAKGFVFVERPDAPHPCDTETGTA